MTNGNDGSNGHMARNGVNGASFDTLIEHPGLISYLTSLGLDNAELTELSHLLRTGKDEELVRVIRGMGAKVPVRDLEQWDVDTGHRTIKLYMVEEQQILREVYQSFFSTHPVIKLMKASGDTSEDALKKAMVQLKPDVTMLGVRTLGIRAVDSLEAIREASAEVGLVLTFAAYDAPGIKALREFSMDSPAGCAYLLKHTIDSVDQLAQVIYSVVQGRIIVDPSVMDALISTGDSYGVPLSRLSPEDTEMLGRPEGIGAHRPVDTPAPQDRDAIQTCFDDVYAELKGIGDALDPAVRAALICLAAASILAQVKPNDE
ncbi:MAG: response regulator transcription factor [Chloroflexi bacterium]|nr:response regulator transcription factor [Chloroflexota bacterium]